MIGPVLAVSLATASSPASLPKIEYAPPQAAAAAALLLAGPRIGVRVGGGSWNGSVLDGGIDVTCNVPFIPVPALRADLEGWTSANPFGKDRIGKAFSVLAVQNAALVYFGAGPSYYWSDHSGDRHNGLGAKILVGANLPGKLYVEGGAILGPTPIPAVVTIGTHF